MVWGDKRCRCKISFVRLLLTGLYLIKSRVFNPLHSAAVVRFSEWPHSEFGCYFRSRNSFCSLGCSLSSPLQVHSNVLWSNLIWVYHFQGMGKCSRKYITWVSKWSSLHRSDYIRIFKSCIDFMVIRIKIGSYIIIILSYLIVLFQEHK